ncbi:MAG: NAD-dependent malic enzyme [Clostridia bacterium]|nr:NAD-dependent malic enzyme [Clostridia bacterium]
MNGAGSAGIAIAKFLLGMGVRHMTLCDKAGTLFEGKEGMTAPQAELAAVTNKEKLDGTLSDAMKGADVFIGVSAPGIVTKEMVASMNAGAIVFPMANPTPEIAPDLALEAGAAVVGTGRSDFNNQINNVLAFPGIFRGALDARASAINDEMKRAASYAIASLVSDEELSPEYIMPKAFDPRVGKTVAAAVREAAVKTGVARI